MARLFNAIAKAFRAMRDEGAATLAAPRYFSATPIRPVTWS